MNYHVRYLELFGDGPYRCADPFLSHFGVRSWATRHANQIRYYNEDIVVATFSRESIRHVALPGQGTSHIGRGPDAIQWFDEYTGLNLLTKLSSL